MGIKLRSDIMIHNSESRIREYCEIEVYFGYDDKHSVDDLITKSDIDAANQLYAMIDRYDKNESKRLLAQAPRISILLSKIPNQPLHSFNDKEWADLSPIIELLLKRMLSIYGIGIDKATKILHLKRPKLFPILDSLLFQFLTGKIPSSSTRGVKLELSTLNKSRQIIQSQIEEFIELQRKVSDLPIDLTIVRLFDILCWSTQKWDIQGKTAAPNGVASYSLLKAVNTIAVQAEPNLVEYRFVTYNDEAHRDGFYELNLEYLTWVDNELSSRYDVNINPNGSVKEYLDRVFPKFTKIAPPGGIIYILEDEGNAVGMGVLRKLDDNVGEVKRMYIRPQYRGGYGKKLLRLLEEKAREFELSTLRLDTAKFMAAALHIYRKAGFKETGYYTGNEFEQDHASRIAIYMEKQL